MKTLRNNKYSLCLKGISLLLSFMLVSQSVAWAHPDRMDLAIHTMFDSHIRNFGLAKSYVSYISDVFPDLDLIPGDIHINAGGGNIPLEMMLKQAKGLKDSLSLKKNEYMIPVNISDSAYYVFLTKNEKERIEEISVFTEDEFLALRPGRIEHRKLAPHYEKAIEHEVEYDIPLSIAHADKKGMKPITKKIQEQALAFFKHIGAGKEFLNEAEAFMATEGALTLTRKKSDLVVYFSGQETRYLGVIEATKAHASNSYINIPQDTYDDITQVLIHELAAKCGTPHSFNTDLDALYDKWDGKEQITGKDKKKEPFSFRDILKKKILNIIKWPLRNKVFTFAIGMLIYIHIKNFFHFIPHNDRVFITSLLSFPGVFFIIALTYDAGANFVSRKLKGFPRHFKERIKDALNRDLKPKHPILYTVVNRTMILLFRIIIPSLWVVIKKLHSKVEDNLAGEKLGYVIKFAEKTDAIIRASESDKKDNETAAPVIETPAPKENIYTFLKHMVGITGSVISRKRSISISKTAKKEILLYGMLDAFRFSVHILALYLLKAILTGHGVHIHFLINIGLGILAGLVLARNASIFVKHLRISKAISKMTDLSDEIYMDPRNSRDKRYEMVQKLTHLSTGIFLDPNHQTRITEAITLLYSKQCGIKQDIDISTSIKEQQKGTIRSLLICGRHIERNYKISDMDKIHMIQEQAVLYAGTDDEAMWSACFSYILGGLLIQRAVTDGYPEAWKLVKRLMDHPHFADRGKDSTTFLSAIKMSMRRAFSTEPQKTATKAPENAVIIKGPDLEEASGLSPPEHSETNILENISSLRFADLTKAPERDLSASGDHSDIGFNIRLEIERILRQIRDSNATRDKDLTIPLKDPEKFDHKYLLYLHDYLMENFLREIESDDKDFIDIQQLSMLIGNTTRALHHCPETIDTLLPEFNEALERYGSAEQFMYDPKMVQKLKLFFSLCVEYNRFEKSAMPLVIYSYCYASAKEKDLFLMSIKRLYDKGYADMISSYIFECLTNGTRHMDNSKEALTAYELLFKVSSDKIKAANNLLARPQNTISPKDIDPVLRDPVLLAAEPAIAAKAIRALARMNDPASVRVLLRYLQSASDPLHAFKHLADGIGQEKDMAHIEHAIVLIVDKLKIDHELNRNLALRALGRIPAGRKAAIPYIESEFLELPPLAEVTIADGARDIVYDRTIILLETIALLKDPRFIPALSLKLKEAIDLWEQEANDPYEIIEHNPNFLMFAAMYACNALSLMDHPDALSEMAGLLDCPIDPVRWIAIMTLSETGDERSFEALVRTLFLSSRYSSDPETSPVGSTARAGMIYPELCGTLYYLDEKDPFSVFCERFACDSYAGKASNMLYSYYRKSAFKDPFAGMAETHRQNFREALADYEKILDPHSLYPLLEHGKFLGHIDYFSALDIYDAQGTPLWWNFLLSSMYLAPNNSKVINNEIIPFIRSLKRNALSGKYQLKWSKEIPRLIMTLCDIAGESWHDEIDIGPVETSYLSPEEKQNLLLLLRDMILTWKHTFSEKQKNNIAVRLSGIFTRRPDTLNIRYYMTTLDLFSKLKVNDPRIMNKLFKICGGKGHKLFSKNSPIYAEIVQFIFKVGTKEDKEAIREILGQEYVTRKLTPASQMYMDVLILSNDKPTKNTDLLDPDLAEQLDNRKLSPVLDRVLANTPVLKDSKPDPYAGLRSPSEEIREIEVYTLKDNLRSLKPAERKKYTKDLKLRARLLRILDSKKDFVETKTAICDIIRLLKLNDTGLNKLLYSLAYSYDNKLAVAAIQALGASGDTSQMTIDVLSALAKDENKKLSQAAKKAKTRLVGKDLPKSHPKPGGSGADYLMAAANSPELRDNHTFTSYKKTVRPEVSDRTIRNDRKKLQERGYLKRKTYYDYALTEDGKKRAAVINNVLAGADSATHGMACSLVDFALNLKENDNGLFALDDNLAKEGTIILVKKLISDIIDITEDERLKKALEHLVIISGKGERLAKTVSEYTKTGKNGIKVKPENAMIITKASVDYYKANCSGLMNSATITFVDDSQLDIMDYYPVVELSFFTIAKALYRKKITTYNANKLSKLYKELNIEHISDDLIVPNCIDANTVTLILKPIEAFHYDELQHIYRQIREFMEAA